MSKYPVNHHEDVLAITGTTHFHVDLILSNRVEKADLLHGMSSAEG